MTSHLLYHTTTQDVTPNFAGGGREVGGLQQEGGKAVKIPFHLQKFSNHCYYICKQNEGRCILIQLPYNTSRICHGVPYHFFFRKNQAIRIIHNFTINIIGKLSYERMRQMLHMNLANVFYVFPNVCIAMSEFSKTQFLELDLRFCSLETHK